MDRVKIIKEFLLKWTDPKLKYSGIMAQTMAEKLNSELENYEDALSDMLTETYDKDLPSMDREDE